MPDLGTYSLEVLGSYGVTLALLALIVVFSLRRARKVRMALEEVENRRVANG